MKLSDKLTARINLSLYSFLLIITPFIMLQNYLQDAIGKLSRLSIPLGETDFPLMILIVIILAIVGTFLLIKNFSKNRLFGIFLVVVLLIIAYNTSDYYFNHHFYDIQHNWHYIAYGLFSWLAWRQFSLKGLSTGKIVVRTFLLALSISVFDELIQVFISDRVFDLSDCAKDLWGSILGQIFIHFVIFDSKYLSFKKFWPAGKKKFYDHVSYLLVIELLFAWVFLNVASILSDDKYSGEVILFTLLFSFLLFVLFQLASGKTGRIVLYVIIGVFVLTISGTLLFSKPKVKYISENLILYKGIPVLYFDLMIYPDGLMRPVDKKTHFNMRDQSKINAIGPDILLIATGTKGQGGTGFHDQKKVEMNYNPEDKKMYQIIKLPTKEACKLYNKLAGEGKKVLMIIHNS